MICKQKPFIYNSNLWFNGLHSKILQQRLSPEKYGKVFKMDRQTKENKATKKTQRQGHRVFWRETRVCLRNVLPYLSRYLFSSFLFFSGLTMKNDGLMRTRHSSVLLLPFSAAVSVYHYATLLFFHKKTEKGEKRQRTMNYCKCHYYFGLEFIGAVAV